jgi:hypothetical protein
MRVLALASMWLVAGCYRLAAIGEPTTWARTDHNGREAIERATIELPCDWDAITVTALGAGGYRIQGCGLVATYTCTRGCRTYGTACERDGEILSAPALASRTVAVADVPAASPSPSIAERALRDALDVQRDAILVCTSHHAVAVRVAWSIEGMTAVSLDGAPHATPTEGCVRDVLESLRAPPSAHGGTLLQAIRP